MCLFPLRAFYPAAHERPDLMIGFIDLGHSSRNSNWSLSKIKRKREKILTPHSCRLSGRRYNSLAGNGEKNETTLYLQNFVVHLLFRHNAIISFRCAWVARYPGNHHQHKKHGAPGARHVTPACIGWRRHALFKQAKIKKLTKQLKPIRQMVCCSHLNSSTWCAFKPQRRGWGFSTNPAI